MKKRFYLVRHGAKVKQMGDPPLSELGQRQARATGIFFKPIQVDKIISSPLLRTKQTAEIIADESNIQVATDPLLKERVNWGDDPNQSIEDFLAMWSRSTVDRDWVPPVGDSSRKSGDRLNRLLTTQPSNVDPTVLVTHGGIITDFLRNAFSEDQLNQKYPNFTNLVDDSIYECSITTVDFDRETGEYELVELASINHLKDLNP